MKYLSMFSMSTVLKFSARTPLSMVFAKIVEPNKLSLKPFKALYMTLSFKIKIARLEDVLCVLLLSTVKKLLGAALPGGFLWKN